MIAGIESVDFIRLLARKRDGEDALTLVERKTNWTPVWNLRGGLVPATNAALGGNASFWTVAMAAER